MEIELLPGSWAEVLGFDVHRGMKHSDNFDTILSGEIEDDETVEIPRAEAFQQLWSQSSDGRVGREQLEAVLKLPDQHVRILRAGLCNVIVNAIQVIKCLDGSNDLKHERRPALLRVEPGLGR